MDHLSQPERVPGARLVSLFRAAPAPLQRVLVSVGRRAPGRSLRWGNMRRLRPVSDRYGYDRGTPVDRYYIERFLSEHAECIRGNVLEVKDAHYTRRFGSGARSHVVDIDRDNPDADPHGHDTDFWRWTPNGLAELLRRVEIPAFVSGYGNVLACVSALWGLSVEDLSAEELDSADPRFPLVACAYAKKPG